MKATIKILVAVALLAASCTKKFASDNTNPANATAAMLQYDNLGTGAFFLQMEENVFCVDVNQYQLQQNLTGDVYSGYMGASDNWNSNNNTTTYYMIQNWADVAFTRGFGEVMAAWKQIQTLSQTARPDVYAMAQIIK